MNRPEKNNWDPKIYELASVYEMGDLNVFLDPETFQELINYYESEEQFEKALDVARIASTHYRFSADFYIRRGQLLLQINCYREALTMLEEALTIAPGDMELNLLKSEAFIRIGDITRGLANLAPFKLQADGEHLSEILLIESLAYERNSDYHHMFYALKAALEAYPSNERALERISLCVEACHKHEEVIELYHKLLDLNAYAHLVWYCLGQAYAYLNKTEDALEAYEYAFLTEVNFEDAYQEFIDLAIEAGRYQEALSTLQELSERFGTDGDTFLRIGYCFHALDQHETARNYLEQAARIEPHNEEVFYQLGACYAAQEKWSKAVAFYRKAVRMSPKSELYHQALAVSAFELGNYELAESAYRQALSLAPDNGQVWLDLAWFLLEMLRPDEALIVLSEVYETLAEEELKFSYCACLFANGRRQEALLYLSEILADNYQGFTWLFEWQPILRSDNEVQALLSLYRPT